MNRFRKQAPERQNEDQPVPQKPMRQFTDDAQAIPPSMRNFQLEVTAYWLLPIVIFCAILAAGIFVAFKYDLFSFGAGEAEELPRYIAASGEILVPELMDSYINAIGGRDALENIQSVRYRGRIAEQSGEIQFQILVSLPDKGMIITRPGEATSQKIVLNQNKAWTEYRGQDDETVVTALGPKDTASLQWSLRVHNTFRALAMDGLSEGFSVQEVELLDRPCYELTKVMPNQSKLRATLDAETLHLLKLSETPFHANDSEKLEVFYSDHRNVSGLVEAHQTKTYKGGQLYNEVYLDYIEINPGLMSSLFEVPTELTE